MIHTVHVEQTKKNIAYLCIFSKQHLTPDQPPCLQFCCVPPITIPTPYTRFLILRLGHPPFVFSFLYSELLEQYVCVHTRTITITHNTPYKHPTFQSWFNLCPNVYAYVYFLPGHTPLNSTAGSPVVSLKKICGLSRLVNR